MRFCGKRMSSPRRRRVSLEFCVTSIRLKCLTNQCDALSIPPVDSNLRGPLRSRDMVFKRYRSLTRSNVLSRPSTHDPIVKRSRLDLRLTCCLLIGSFLVGCGGESAESRLNKAIPIRDKVVPFAGIVTVDGEPGTDLTLRLVPDGAKAPQQSDPKTVTTQNGKFHFTTYLDGDGVRPGTYSMLVERLERIGSSGWGGPDQLNNLFNHLESPAAKIEITDSTPRKDFTVNLEVKGKAKKPAPPYVKVHTGKPIKGKTKRAGQ